MDKSAKIREVLSNLTPMRVIGERKVRLGGDSDGGYVMIDHFSKDMVAYSLGVGGDVSWDMDIASRDIEVFQFDHTVSGTPEKHSKFHFFKTGIAATDDTKSGMKSLDTLLKEHKHNNRELILKMDIEDSEWPVIDALDPVVISKFTQIVLEFHGFARLQHEEWLNMSGRVLSKLRQSHVPFHVHGNNWGEYCVIDGVPVPDVLEISYAARNSFSFAQNQETFPTSLDKPCKLDKADFYLGRFEFGLGVA
jgi:hypothetical protein